MATVIVVGVAVGVVVDVVVVDHMQGLRHAEAGEIAAFNLYERDKRLDGGSVKRRRFPP